MDEYAQFGSVVPGGESACGVYCLYIAARLMGMDVDINALARAAKLDLNGATMLGLKQAAESIGLVAKGLAYSKEQWSAIRPLSIVHVEKHHYVLFLKATSNSVEVVDPPNKRIVLSAEEFREKWDGSVLELERKAQEVKQHNVGAQEHTEISIVVPADNKEEIQADFDFGDIYAEREYLFTIKICNKSGMPLRYNHCKTNCGCTMVVPIQKETPNGETGYFEGHFSTVSLAGQAHSKVIMVFGEEPNQRIVRLALQANILTEGRLRAVPPTIRFNTTKGVACDTVMLTVKRDSNQLLGLTGISVNSNWLSAAKSDKAGGDQSSCTWDISCHGDIPAGEHQASITITTDHSNFSKIKIPVSIVVKNDVEVSPSRLLSVVTNDSLSQEKRISFRSLSKTDFRITKVQMVPADIGKIKYDRNHLASHQDVVIELTRPSKESSSILTGQIVIEFEHPTCSKLVVPVSIKNEIE